MQQDESLIEKPPPILSLEDKLRLKNERENITIWKSPVTTIHYFICESGHLSIEYMHK